MSQFTGTVTLSVDDDGFLRRECPHCRLEFKWLNGDHGKSMPAGGYHCPYCDGRSEDGWWTRPQLTHIKAQITALVQDEVRKGLKGLERSSSEPVKFSVRRSPTAPIPPLPDEPNDMRRINFDCHPAEPVKVVETWAGPVHCLICGTEVAPA